MALNKNNNSSHSGELIRGILGKCPAKFCHLKITLPTHFNITIPFQLTTHTSPLPLETPLQLFPFLVPFSEPLTPNKTQSLASRAPSHFLRSQLKHLIPQWTQLVLFYKQLMRITTTVNPLIFILFPLSSFILLPPSTDPFLIFLPAFLFSLLFHRRAAYKSFVPISYIV